MPEPQLICTVKATIFFAHAEPQRGDAVPGSLVGNDVDAAENDLVESRGRKGLPRQERPAALHARSTGVNGPGPERAFRNGVRLPSTIKTGLASACRPLFTQLLEELMHVGSLCNRRQRFGCEMSTSITSQRLHGAA